MLAFRKYADLFLFGIICSIPFISLVIFTDAVYPYVTAKNFSFRFLLLIGAGIWTILATIDPQYRPHKSKLVNCFLLFLLIVFISDIFGANFRNSFWSNFSRMEGFLSLIYYFLFFVILSSTLQTEKRWNIYWGSHIFVSILIFATAVLQKMKIVFSVDYNRVDSTFGNSSYLAIYSSMIFFLCIYLYYSVSKRLFKVLIMVAALCNLASIYVSQTRSATLAVILCSAFYVFSVMQNKKKAALTISSLFTVFVGAIFIFRSKTEFTTNLFERISSMSLQDESIQARYQIWSYCLRAIQDKPWLGWGQESFSYLTGFYNPALWSAPWVDRAHNLFIEWWVNSGVFGLLAFCFLLVTLMRFIWESNLARHRKSALVAFFLSWFVNQFFSIDFFSIAVLFYSFVTFGHVLQQKPSEAIGDKPKLKKLSRIEVALLAVLFLVIAVGVNYEFNIKSFITNYQMRQFTKPEFILASAVKKPFRTGFDELLKEDHYYETTDIQLFLAQNALYLLGQNQPGNKYSEYLQFIYTDADIELQKLIRDDSKNLTFKYSAASFYSQFMNEPRARALYQELLEKVPQQQYFLIDFAHFHINQGRYSDGVRLYRKAYELDPTFYQAKMFLAMGLVYEGNITEANKLTHELLELSRPEGFDERLINAYVNHHQPTMAKELIDFKNRFLKESEKK